MNNTQSIINHSGISFGTSGARGLVVDFTPEVCAAFTHAFVAILRQEFSPKQLALAIDNRPSSYAMAQACAAALLQAGVEPIYYGVIPTPALAYQAMQDNMPCIMVTGSHIPFDRNGLKFYRPDGEITKTDELAILAAEVEFDTLPVLPALVASPRAAESYCARYASLFAADMLKGKRIGIYEHSSAGRELYAPLLKSLGAEVVRIERSDQFVPIDTEAVGEEDKSKARRWSVDHQLDAIFSTDGDGDRPLVADERGEWLRGDILGLLCACALRIEALVIPISSNTVISSCGLFNKVELTKIGSPYVIAEFSQLAKKYQRIAGFEANGGFLLGSDIEVNDQLLAALPTRDAVLPFLMLLASAGHDAISSLVSALPQRFTHSDRIKNFPTEFSRALVYEGKNNPSLLLNKLGLYDKYVAYSDYTDGLRLFLTDDCIIHLRPSGNAPELRCYAEANTYDEAKRLVDVSLERIYSLLA
ncbi:phosphomannomutase [Aeromonas dhakensis]|nr:MULTISPECIES: phosphomannomutase [Aeromonas]AGM44872.1 phosphomannomutase [Aeromonas hydrophila ML09-119]EGX6956497.1 phosphomannomutase [Aeromonas hydrophila]MBC6397743.1 phosphomannomutase [Aeromonas hydrophila]MBW3843893.1 phosphomannomutase [Aeromonas hydrophila]MCA4699028.1 phosphomannomutase [Aeromonas hydrophila]